MVDGPVTDISLRELRRRGLAHYSTADLNRDGRLNVDDIAAYLDGARPEPKKEVAQEHLNGMQLQEAVQSPVKSRE